MLYKNVKEETGSREKFIEIYHQSFDYVYSFVFARTAGDAQTSEEIVQETFTAAYASMNRFNNNSSYRTWLCGIAKNKLMDYYRRVASLQRKVMPGHIDISEVPSEWNIEEVVFMGERKQYVIKALASINPIYRYALVMKYLDGYSTKEIAGILKRSPKAVDGILQRAKSSFAEIFYKVSGEVRKDG